MKSILPTLSFLVLTGCAETTKDADLKVWVSPDQSAYGVYYEDSSNRTYQLNDGMSWNMRRTLAQQVTIDITAKEEGKDPQALYSGPVIDRDGTILAPTPREALKEGKLIKGEILACNSSPREFPQNLTIEYCVSSLERENNTANNCISSVLGTETLESWAKELDYYSPCGKFH